MSADVMSVWASPQIVEGWLGLSARSRRSFLT